VTSLYYYTARNADGLLVRGSVEAATEGAALASLRTRALFITSLENESTARGTLVATLQIGPVPQKHLVTFFRSFATLVRAGVPMRRSLEVSLEQCSDGRLREAVASIVNDIENGLALSEAMSRRPKEFTRLFVTMIKAGELGGVVDDVLERLASALERDSAVRKRVISALAYPAIVSMSALALIVFLITSIVPTFRSMYDQMHVPVPGITRTLITVGTLLRNPLSWIGIALAIALSAGIIVRARSTEGGAAALDGLLMRIPVAGAIARKATVGRLARMLGTLLRSGVGLIAALEVVTDVVTSAPYRESVASLRQALGAGSSVSEPLAGTGLYEPMFIQMVRVGEETGALDAMLLRIADYYDLDVETALNALGSILEPAMILLLGGAVGFIVAAIFIPLYTLIGSIK
jgi:type IV pilus assembly protein PilC